MTAARYLHGLTLAAVVSLVGFACTIGPAKTGEIDIATDLPTSGAETSGGLPVQDAAEYAVTTQGSLRGYKLKFVPYDDAVNGVHNPARGAENVKAMIDNPKVLGMIGPKNSDVALAEIPVANAAYLPIVSANNTSECLTQNLPYCKPEPDTLRPTGVNNFFRLTATDASTGPLVAFFAIQSLHVHNFAVWSDNTGYGKNLSDQFSKELERRGGKVLVRKDFDVGSARPDFTGFLRDAAARGAEAIFAGATAATKGCVARAQAKGILDVPYLGGTGLNEPQCIKDAGDMANDKLYCTAAVADVTQKEDPAVKAILNDFKQKYPDPDALGPKSFPGYDAAGILMSAIGQAIDANNGNLPTRKQVITALAATKDYQGASGKYTFNSTGDPTTPFVSFFQVKPTDGKPAWVWTKELSVGAVA